MSEPVVERRSARAPGGVDRRQRKPDPWRKVLNWLAYVVYPLLLINVFIFMGIASEDQKASMASKMEQSAQQLEDMPVQIPQTHATEETPAQAVSGWVHLYAFMPIMVLGVVIGGAGIVLDRKRSRRRTDYSLMTPLVLVVVSVLGMLIYFIVRAIMT